MVDKNAVDILGGFGDACRQEFRSGQLEVGRLPLRRLADRGFSALLAIKYRFRNTCAESARA